MVFLGARVSDDPYVGHRFGGRYEAVSKLGEGGLGTVYKGFQVNLRQDVAIKVLKASVSSDPVIVRRFYNEARVYARINHPNVVQIHDFGQTEIDKTLYLVMEYLPGEDLETYIANRGPLSGRILSGLAIHALQGLAAAHKLDIIHRDIKPANIMILEADTQRPLAKVLDFGISKLESASEPRASGEFDPAAAGIEAGHTMAGTISGTPAFMSPEQCRGQELDPRSDIYAMGLVLYQMVTATLPFTATNPLEFIRMHIQQTPLPPSRVAPDAKVPRFLEEIIMRCLEKPRDDRYQSSDELLTDLERFRDEMGGPEVVSLLDLSDEEQAASIPVSRKSFGDEKADETTRAVVSDLLTQMGKAYKSFVMYPSDNPVFTQMTKNVSHLLTEYFQQFDRLALSIDQCAVYFQKQKAYEDHNLRTSYPFKLFSDGIRQLFFHSGVTAQEISDYFDCLHQVSSGDNLANDLVTLMWEKHFPHIGYHLAEDLIEDELPEIEDLDALMISESEMHYYGKPRGEEAPVKREARKTETQKHEILAPLTAEDREDLGKLLEAEKDVDHVARFIQTLTLVLKRTSELKEVSALIRVLSQLSQALLKVNDFTHVLMVLKPLRLAYDKVTNPDIHALLENILREAGKPVYIHGALETVQTDNTAENMKRIEEYLSLLGAPTIPTLVTALGNSEDPDVRRVIMTSLLKHCKGMPELIKQGLNDENPRVVRDTVILLRETQHQNASHMIIPMLRHADADVRKEAIRALSRLKHPGLIGRALTLVDDSNSKVRLAVIEAIATRPADEAEGPLLDLLNHKHFFSWGYDEKVHIFQALGKVATDDVVDVMEDFLIPSKTALLRDRRVVLGTMVAFGGLLAYLLVQQFGVGQGLAGITLLATVAAIAGSRLPLFTESGKYNIQEQAAYCLEQVGTEDAYEVLSDASNRGPRQTREVCKRILYRRYRTRPGDEDESQGEDKDESQGEDKDESQGEDKDESQGEDKNEKPSRKQA